MKYLLKKSLQFSIAICVGLSCYQPSAQGTPQSKAAIEARVKLASKLLKAGKNADVVASLKPYVLDLPRHGLLALAKAYHAQKNYLEETRILESTLAQNEQDYYVQTLLGECFFSNNELEKAADNFSHAKEIKSDYLPAFQGLAKTYEAKGQVEDARQTYTDMIRAFGSNKFYFNEICRLYAIDGSVQEGIVACQKATSFDPNFAANHIALGQMLIENEQSERGEMIIVRAAKQFKKSTEAQIAAGKLKFKHRQWHDAASYYAQATAINPKSDEAFLGLGKALFELQKYNDAKFAFTKACTLNKKYVVDLRNAIAELRQKDKLNIATDFESGLGRCGG